VPISTDGASNQTPFVQLESFIDDREDSFAEKNSIAEFEMLEKECFKEEDVVQMSK
jgi:hypothetical protein